MVGIDSEAYKVHVVTEAAKQLQETGDDYQQLLDLIGDASVVLLGEATHGSHEFYRERAQITKQLIRRKGFNAIAIEADWPDAYRVNRFVRGQNGDEYQRDSARWVPLEAIDALRGFTRFPSWMWVNADILDFVGWLKSHNEAVTSGESAVGFYGLDLYSLHRSAQAVIDYLEKTDPEAAERARVRYACLERFGSDSQKYAYATGLGLAKGCEDDVIAQLVDLLKQRTSYRKHADGELAADEYFCAEQNSRLVQAAEHYYRTMLNSEVSSWNLRDEHMVETLDRIRDHFTQQGHPPKIVVWAHNSHVGDARATDMARRGEVNIGQLTRQRYGVGGNGVITVGFTTYGGSVTAASSWDGATKRMIIRPALDGSYEQLFHRTGLSRFVLDLRRNFEVARILKAPMLERAIGVLYRPATERLSHYFRASLSEQFDAVIHIDRTRAVEPIEHATRWEVGTEAPETYPTGV